MTVKGREGREKEEKKREVEKEEKGKEGEDGVQTFKQMGMGRIECEAKRGKRFEDVSDTKTTKTEMEQNGRGIKQKKVLKAVMMRVGEGNDEEVP